VQFYQATAWPPPHSSPTGCVPAPDLYLLEASSFGLGCSMRLLHALVDAHLAPGETGGEMVDRYCGRDDKDEKTR
jgi:hypothetical protein